MDSGQVLSANFHEYMQLEDKKEENKEEKNKEEQEKLSQNLEYIEEESEKSLNFERKIKRLKEKLESCHKKKEEYLSGWQRERADFINYKREEREGLEEREFFQKGKIILEFLPILDNIERAEKELPEELEENSWAKGILEIKNQIKDVFKREEVEEIKSIGEKFDPNFMEAVEIVETNDKDSGLIIEEIQKGYLLKGRILRPARVKVGKKSISE